MSADRYLEICIKVEVIRTSKWIKLIREISLAQSGKCLTERGLLEQITQLPVPVTRKHVWLSGEPSGVARAPALWVATSIF